MVKGRKDQGEPNAKPMMDDAEQSRRFIEAARELGLDNRESAEAYERAMARILPPRTPGEPAAPREPPPRPGRRKRSAGT